MSQAKPSQAKPSQAKPSQAKPSQASQAKPSQAKPSQAKPSQASRRNEYLHAAKLDKNDEFYTQLTDIENELHHYKKHFKNKIVLSNCDDPRISNFFHYFSYNFEHLGLKKLITTCYKSRQSGLFSSHDSNKAVWLEYTGDKNGNKVPDVDEIGIHDFKEDGDFRSSECIEILKQSDIVITNPPFSLFREYVAQLIKYKKKFLILANQNAISYKEIFPLFKNNKIWLGASIHNGAREFGVPDSYIPIRKAGFRIDENGKKFRIIQGVRWFTNLDIKKRHEDLILYKQYNKTDYTKYDNYDAINVDKVRDIPVDYNGIMGVPITFMTKYNPEQFEILGQMVTTKIDEFNKGYPYINGKKVYARILIKRRNDVT